MGLYAVIVQSLAIFVRYLLFLIRTWLSSLLIRFALPAGVLYMLGSYYAGLDNETCEMRFHSHWIPMVARLIFSCVVMAQAKFLLVDKSTGFRQLMYCMGLRASAYYTGSLFSFLVLNLQIFVPFASICLYFLFDDSTMSKRQAGLMLLLFYLHLSAYTMALSSLVRTSRFFSLIPAIMAAEYYYGANLKSIAEYLKPSKNVLDSTMILINDDLNGQPHYYEWPLAIMASASPFESLSIAINCYCWDSGNCSLKINDEVISQPLGMTYICASAWTVVLLVFGIALDLWSCPASWTSKAHQPIHTDQPSSSSIKTTDSINPNYGRANSNSHFFEASGNHRQVIGIEISNLNKSFSSAGTKSKVVDDITFQVYEGQTTLLLGHNGAGKTTLMNMILRRLRPNSGFVRMRANAFNSIGFCPQDSILDDNMSIRQHLWFFSTIKLATFTFNTPDIEWTLKTLNLARHSHKLPGQLSGGMRRKLSLALAFVGRSKVLVLDEPSSGLDPDSRVFTWDVIRANRFDKTVLVSTQHMEEAEYLGDRVAIMSSGRIICCGSSIYLNEMFGSGYKLRVECQEERKHELLAYIRRFFPKASIAPDCNTEPTAGGLLDIAIQLVPNLTQLDRDNQEQRLVEMLADIETHEANENNFVIMSHGLRSSTVEDVFLKTTEIQLDNSITIKGDPRDTDVNKQQQDINEKNHSSNNNNKPLKPPMIEVPSIEQSASFTDNVHATDCLSALKAARRSTVGPNRNKTMILLLALLKKNLWTFRNDLFFFVGVKLVVAALCIVKVICNLHGYKGYQVDLWITWSFLLFHFIHYPSLERTSKFKIVQLTSKMTYRIYWVAQLLTDLITIAIYVITYNIAFIFVFECKPEDHCLSIHLIGSAAIGMACVSAAIICYVMSLIVDSHALFKALVLFMGPSTLIASVLYTLNEPSPPFIDDHLYISLWDWSSEILAAFNPADSLALIFFGICWGGYYVTGQDYPERAMSPILQGFICLAAQIGFYSGLLVLIEHFNLPVSEYLSLGSIYGCFRFVCKKPCESNDWAELHSVNVVRRGTSTAPTSTSTIATAGDATTLNNSQHLNLVCHDLVKKYKSSEGIVRRAPRVVDQLSFSVARGECLGLLGVNGAGKSTTFAMLCAESRQNGGRIELSKGCNLLNRCKLGYDPQANPVICMTPRNVLYLMARLRLIGERDTARLVENLLHWLEMSEHANKRVSQLSGGTKRKLTLAMSIMGCLDVLALDEPTSGIDPVARRKIWALLQGLRSDCRCSILISSHAMEECEAICDRIAIMSRGKLRCLGTFLQLRAKFAPGCKLKVQFKSSSDPNYNDKLVGDLEKHLVAKLGPLVELTDKNINSATFTVDLRKQVTANDNYSRSRMFLALREFKVSRNLEGNLIYNINDSSLEDIFKRIAREEEALADNEANQPTAHGNWFRNLRFFS